METNMYNNRTTNQQGFIVGSLLVLIIIISALLLTITSSAIGNFQSSIKENARINAQFASDGGLDQSIYEINQNDTWPGTGFMWDGTAWVGSSAEVTLMNDTANDIRTTYQVTVTDTAPDQKNVRSIGRTYKPSDTTTPTATRIFELELSAVTSGTGPGSVVTGVGGLILHNNAKITGGDVIVNGTLDVDSNAQIGLSTNPVNLRVAHQSCPLPADATYPQVCTTGEPIKNSGYIYADVKAQNQVTSTGMTSPGLTSSVYPPVAVPGYDRPTHKNAVVTTLAPTDSTIACGNNQTRTWPANVKITGNVKLSNNCKVNITGDVWITGNLEFSNNTIIQISDSLGTTRPVIMIDGSEGLEAGNNSKILPNSSNMGAEIITTYWNTNTSTNGGFTCGGIADPLDCTAVTGLALYTSQSIDTLNLSNNISASNTILRTLWTKVEISNNGEIGAIAGQTIQLNNNVIINFTASIPGSDNLTTTWVKRGYLRVFQ